MSADAADSSKTDAERRRVPLERKISLKFKEFRGFITEYSSNVSLGGMFIRTTQPKPPGTIFDFELSLTDDFKLVQGIGEVIWVRDADDGPQRPSGMGVRFLDLSPESRKLVQRIVDEQVAHGGTPFELEPPAFPPPRQAAPAPRAPGPPPSRLFHPTAAPVAPAPPPRLASRPAPVAPPPPAPLSPADVESFPDLGVPELPTPELLSSVSEEPLPDASWEGEPLDGFPLEEAPEPFDVDVSLVDPDDDTARYTPVHDDDRTARLSRDAAAPAVRETSTPGSAAIPPAPPAALLRPRQLAGFDEVARALGETPAAAEHTARLPALAVPAATALAAAAATPPRAPAAPPPVAAVPVARPTGPPAPRRKRRVLPAAAGLLLLLLAAVGVVYFFFPQLLPSRGRQPSERTAAIGGVRDRPAASRPGAVTAPPGATLAATPPPTTPAVGPTAAFSTVPRPRVPGTTALLPAPPAAAAPTRLSTTPGLPAGGLATAPATGRPPAGAPSAADAASAPPAALTTPRPAAATARFTAVDEVWGQRGPVGTVVTIVANGAVPADAVTHFRLEGDHPREVVRLRGVDDTFKHPTIPVGTAEIKQLRTGYHAADRELRIVLDLASSHAKLLTVTAKDNRLEVLVVNQ